MRNASLDEICEFAQKLVGGFDDWNVEVREFVETRIAGTIRVEPSARTIIETWRGEHYLNSGNIQRCHAEYDPEKFHHRFHWQASEGIDNLPELQMCAMKALRYIFPHLKPRPDEPIYLEYGVKPSGEIFFIEANDSPLLTSNVIR